MTKHRFWFAVKLLLGLGLFAVILASVDLSSLGRLAARVSVAGIAVCAALVLVQAVLLAARWTMLARAADQALPIGASVRGILISFFFSQGLPSSVGADAFRIWWLKRAGSGMGTAARVVLLDRMLGFAFLLLLCVASLVILADIATVGRSASVLLALAVVLAGGLIFMGLLLNTRSTGLLDRVLAPFERRGGTVGRLAGWVRDFRGAARVLLRRRGEAALIAAISLSVHLLTVLICYLIAADVGGNVTALQALAVLPPGLLLSYLPITIAGWGVREASLVGGFALIGVGGEVGLIVSLGFGLLVLAVSLIGGALWTLGTARDAFRKSHEPFSAPERVP